MNKTDSAAARVLQALTTARISRPDSHETLRSRDAKLFPSLYCCRRSIRLGCVGRRGIHNRPRPWSVYSRNLNRDSDEWLLVLPGGNKCNGFREIHDNLVLHAQVMSKKYTKGTILKLGTGNVPEACIDRGTPPAPDWMRGVFLPGTPACVRWDDRRRMVTATSSRLKGTRRPRTRQCSWFASSGRSSILYRRRSWYHPVCTQRKGCVAGERRGRRKRRGRLVLACRHIR